MNFRVDIIGDNELVLKFNNASKEIKDALNSELVEVAKHLQKEIKGKFGEYQPGWPKLKRASVIAKYRKRALRGIKSSSNVSGLAQQFNSFSIGPDEPLILFNELKESIEYETNKAAMTATVFSDKVYAAVHEYGYKNVPSRSYMRKTLWDEEDIIIKMINNRIDRII